MAADVRSVARNILEHRVPYFACLLGLKALALLASVTGWRGGGFALLLEVCAASCLADIVLRLASSSRRSLDCGKYGTDLFLSALLLAQAWACGAASSAGEQASSGSDEISLVRNERYCHGLALVLPFALLVSTGGNLLRLTREPPRRDCTELGDPVDDAEGYYVGRAGNDA
eukprot:TRINITY_DN47248_c0_g1_i1.p1 TRINITY_DN47248_c0_g1~~TRINITY_DN47248_c0_g1_i1.p1  ORF type:complete len:199 (+),score=33.48 TRINITY_DN47248_c0_g1_i1:83-598(+)